MEMIEDKIKQQAENVGMVCDKDGFPPLAGRLLGFLMLANPPHQSFDEIVDFLQASKSAVSTTLKFLEAQGMVEYITFPGDRKRYFRMNVAEWPQVILKKMEFIKMMKTQILKVLEIRGDEYKEFNDGLRNICDLYEIFLEEMPLLVEKWKRRVEKRKMEMTA
jgi:DNA-binding transcriptional regulator GbsR (MarR family)